MFYAGLVLLHTREKTENGGGAEKRGRREEKADSNSQAQNNSHLKMCHSSNTGEEWNQNERGGEKESK